MSAERSSVPAKWLAAPERDQCGSLNDWVAQRRRICLENIGRSGIEGRGTTLRERSFPSSSGDPREFSDALYSESAWAASTLAVCFLAYGLSTGNLVGALAFTLVASLLMLPILVVWAALGSCYAGKRNRT